MADRSIKIKRKRKTTNEPAERLDRHARFALGEVARKIARWALDNRATVQSAEPGLSGALDARASDNWRPLLALAETAGGKWPSRATAAALALSGRCNDDGIAVAVLAAIKDLFAAQSTDRLGSKRIVAALTADPTARWNESNRGKPLSRLQRSHGRFREHGRGCVTYWLRSAFDSKIKWLGGKEQDNATDG